MELVGLEPSEFMGRYPMDMSGGQAQRVAIARAVVKDPQVMLADEAMSAIDVAARMQILDAFAAIRERDPNMAMVLVSHDLGVVQNIADRIVVMHEGASWKAARLRRFSSSRSRSTPVCSLRQQVCESVF